MYKPYYSKRIVVCILFLLGHLFTVNSIIAYSKPMESPTLEEAVKSKTIVIAEYIGFENRPLISYYPGAKAYYRVVGIIKGQSIEKYIKVNYAFTDGSICVIDLSWWFPPIVMPKKGSNWILFLNDEDNDGIYDTYRGDYGRWEVSEKNLMNVKSTVYERYGSDAGQNILKNKRPVIINYYFAAELTLSLIIYLFSILHSRKQELQ